MDPLFDSNDNDNDNVSSVTDVCGWDYRLAGIIEMMIRRQSSKSRGGPPVTNRGNDELDLLDLDNAIFLLTGKFVLFIFQRI